MLETITSRDNPNAALQVVNTRSTVCIMQARIMWVFRIMTEAIMKMDSIMPSKQAGRTLDEISTVRSPVGTQ